MIENFFSYRWNLIFVLLTINGNRMLQRNVSGEMDGQRWSRVRYIKVRQWREYLCMYVYSTTIQCSAK